jgi:hypothetical protein
MIVRQESGTRWLAVRIGDFEKWQPSLLEESARRLGAAFRRVLVASSSHWPGRSRTSPMSHPHQRDRPGLPMRES